jgi:hypothetical protein
LAYDGLRAPEVVCDLGIITFAQDARVDRLPLLGGKLRERASDALLASAESFDRLVRVIIEHQVGQTQAPPGSALDSAPPEALVQDVASDPEHPLVRPTARRVIRRQRLQHAGERLGRQIGRNVRRPGATSEIPQHRLLKVLVERREPVRPAPQRSIDQPPLVGRGPSLPHTHH